MGRQASREKEAKRNRRQYRTWQDVLAEGTWLQCGRCGLRQFRKGDLMRKACRRCSAPLVETGI
jgi:hypothetical protein